MVLAGDRECFARLLVFSMIGCSATAWQRRSGSARDLGMGWSRAVVLPLAEVQVPPPAETTGRAALSAVQAVLKC